LPIDFNENKKMNEYNYQQSNRYFAQIADDIKELGETELKSLGATGISRAYRGLYFNADQTALYRINLHSRLINRVLAPLITFKCHSDKYLYQTARQINWEDFITPEHTFAVFATVTQSNINHSKFAALRLKDAIADYFKNKTGKRPSVDTRQPDLWLNLYIENNEAVISIDTSGGSLHRRGYRLESTQAPMAETVAASIIKLTEWDNKSPLYDPFCGSGTILAEAYLSATNTPSAYMRKKFGFERLPDYNKKLWSAIKNEGLKNTRSLSKGLISGSDISTEVTKTAQKNIAVIDRDKIVSIKQKDVFSISSLENSTIICNPPYGLRMAKGTDLSNFYKSFGDFLKQRCKGSTVYIYFGNRLYLKSIGLRTTWKIPLQNGGLDGRLAKFELY
jgi:putative N6-adenine-specific DNA methylase